MLQDLKIAPKYEGFLFLAQSGADVPQLQSHHHIELELNLVVRGTITYVMHGERFTFPAGTLLWLFPEQEHQLVDRSSNALNYVVVFKPSLIRKSCRTPRYQGLKRSNTEGGGILHTQLDSGTFDLVRRTMDALMVDGLDAQLLSREAGFGVQSDFRFEHGDPDGLNAGLHYLLMLCWRLQLAGKQQRPAVVLHPSVSRVLQMLSEGDLERNLGAISRDCGVSEAHLSRMFHQQIGVPMSRYRNSLRLARFWEEYRRPNRRTVSEAVYAAGFGSYAQFYKVFVSAHGVSPRASLSNTGI